MIRKSPSFRGLGRLYRLFNSAMMSCGAQPTVIAKMADGTDIIVDLRSFTEVHAFYRGEYEPNLVTMVRTLLDPDCYFLDIGANIGFYTVAVGAFIKSEKGAGRVIAFEPYEANFNRLRANISTNRLNEFCITHKSGLSNRSGAGLITLREDFLYGSNTGNAAMPTGGSLDEGFPSRPISLERLDDVWDRWYADGRKIDVIKIDIEGHEDFCLQGGKKTIREHRPTVLMELNKPYYRARGVEPEETLLPLIPEAYSVFRNADSGWKRITSFEQCRSIEDIFMIPEEKSGLRSYAAFD